jgi:hypothetical protein
MSCSILLVQHSQDKNKYIPIFAKPKSEFSYGTEEELYYADNKRCAKKYSEIKISCCTSLKLEEFTNYFKDKIFSGPLDKLYSKLFKVIKHVEKDVKIVEEFKNLPFEIKQDMFDCYYRKQEKERKLNEISIEQYLDDCEV